MKCLSLKQPYAYFLASGFKTIEIRKWNTHFRGEFLIHASKTVNNEAMKVYPVASDRLIRGAIIGKAYLYSVKKYTNHKNFINDHGKHFSIDKTNFASSFKRYGFMIHNSIVFEKSIPYHGKLGFFEVDGSLLDSCNFRESVWYIDV